ncbi:hypothetical protein D3C87_1457250 [compost metagenome]
MLEQVRLILLGIVGERRAAHRARCADHRRHAAKDLRVVDQGFEDVWRALRIADQYESRPGGVERRGHDRIADLPCVMGGAGQRIDRQHPAVIAKLAQVPAHRIGRTQPRREAIKADAGHDHRHQWPVRGAEVRRLAGAGRLRAHARQGFLAGAVVGHGLLAGLEDRAEDLAEARPPIAHAGGSGRQQDQRRGLGGVGHQRLRGASRQEGQRQHPGQATRAHGHPLRRLAPSPGCRCPTGLAGGGRRTSPPAARRYGSGRR